MTVISGKVAAITGAASGIGRALAVCLAERGAQVAISDVDEAGLQETAALLPQGSRHSAKIVDVRDRHAVARWAAEVGEIHGGAHIIVNNAGVAVRRSFEETSYEEFAFIMDVNLWGVVHGVKAFLPWMRKAGAGHIVNVASISAMVPLAKLAPYNASKFAVLGLSETLMQELRGQPIKVSCVMPGGVRTNIARNGMTRGFTADDADWFGRIARTLPAGAAERIARGIERNEERVYVGLDAKIMAAAKRLFPAATVHSVGYASRDVQLPR